VEAAQANGVYLGVWQPGAPQDMTAISRFERDARKHVAIVNWYQGWGAANAALDPTLLTGVAAHGSVPLITWEPWDYTQGLNQPAYSLANIIAGNFDSYITSWAQGLASYGRPVLLRWAHEMNIPNYPWSVGVNGNTADEYVAAWRHVRSIFVAQGALNVQWVWCPNVAWNAATAFGAEFPGDGYVDWVGLDGYNNVNWGGWKSFNQIFGSSYIALTALSGRPVMIDETASGEAGGNKAKWISDAFSVQIQSAFPRIRAVLWFNENQTATIGVDWRIESTSASQQAFARAMQAATYLGSWVY